MKAYEIFDKDGYNEFSLLVFAESRGKAISFALGTDEFPYCDWEYTQLRAKRRKKLDGYYRGNRTMDWENQADRFAIVKELGWYCGEDYFDYNNCKDCCAKDICYRYEKYQEEMEES